MKSSLSLLGAAALVSSSFAWGQAVSVNGGSIQGTITDASGATVPNAQITLVSPDTGFTKQLSTDSSGFYSVGPLNPGNYTVTATAPGFQRFELKTVVRTGTATTGSFKLTVGSASDTVEVTAGSVQVNSEQFNVSDVITGEQIANLPIQGRNFMDVAQIEPGVILQSGSTFDPTKNGYSAISVSGVSGRTTRILLDGQDITDETVGATIMNVSQGAINEFQLNRSTQDVSGEVTSTGQVLVSTNSGTNAFHGFAFYNFQDHRAGFATLRGLDIPFQRNQFGGSVGGPILRDKLFFFANVERIKQDSSASSQIDTTLFPSLAAAYPTVPSPFRDTYSTGRLDWNGPLHGHYFARVSYEANATTTANGNGFWLFSNRDNIPAYAFGADFTSGRLTHSFRGSYEKFHNFIADASQGNSSLYIPKAFSQPFSFYNNAAHLFTGPNYLAPQVTYQTDKQLRYDGSWTKGAHSIRYGASLNRVLGGGFASFYGLAPRAASTAATRLTNANCPATGPVTDPTLCYAPSAVVIGNGVGYATADSAFSYPGGGLYSWRVGAYIADAWKVTPSFTVSAGLRWSLDTNRQGQNLASAPCSDLNSIFGSPCSGNTAITSLFDPSFTGRTNTPTKNFGPQLGFNFSPGSHKTAIRGGVGIYYESSVWNNLTNANGFQKTGLIYTSRTVCGGANSLSIPNVNGAPGSSSTITSIDGQTIASLCAQPIAQSYSHFINLQNLYRGAVQTVGPSLNNGYIGQTLTAGGLFSPNYKSPYSIQFNGGVQQELWKGAVISVDYVHNATQRITQSVDVNRDGSARSLNVTAATNAITTTTVARGCSGGASAAAVTCAIAAGARITDFARTGLESGNVFLTNNPAVYKGRTVATGAAFPGLNPNLGRGLFILPVGRSGYDAMQVVFRQQQVHPAPGIQNANYQISYSLSRSVSNSSGLNGDEFFSAGPYDYDQTTRYMGPNGLDHLHAVNMGGSFLLRYGPRLSAIGHFYSAPPSNLSLDNLSGTAAQIFRTDVTGDGTTGDLTPGTNPGQYMRGVNGKNLAGFINNYNATQAGKPTPAGQALINAGLMTNAQLYALGAVQPTIAAPTNGTGIQNPIFRTFDATFSYPIRLGHYVHRLGESASLEPAVAMYNVFNMANYTTPSGLLLASNYGAVTTTDANSTNYVNGPNTYSVQDQDRIQRGSGTFSQGAPRSTEFQLKLNF